MVDVFDDYPMNHGELARDIIARSKERRSVIQYKNRIGGKMRDLPQHLSPKERYKIAKDATDTEYQMRKRTKDLPLGFTVMLDGDQDRASRLRPEATSMVRSVWNQMKMSNGRLRQHAAHQQIGSDSTIDVRIAENMAYVSIYSKPVPKVEDVVPSITDAIPVMASYAVDGRIFFTCPDDYSAYNFCIDLSGIVPSPPALLTSAFLSVLPGAAESGVIGWIPSLPPWNQYFIKFRATSISNPTVVSYGGKTYRDADFEFVTYQVDYNNTVFGVGGGQLVIGVHAYQNEQKFPVGDISNFHFTAGLYGSTGAGDMYAGCSEDGQDPSVWRHTGGSRAVVRYYGMTGPGGIGEVRLFTMAEAPANWFMYNFDTNSVQPMLSVDGSSTWHVISPSWHYGEYGNAIGTVGPGIFRVTNGVVSLDGMNDWESGYTKTIEVYGATLARGVPNVEARYIATNNAGFPALTTQCLVDDEMVNSSYNTVPYGASEAIGSFAIDTKLLTFK